jgi:hypothetical protein
MPLRSVAPYANCDTKCSSLATDIRRGHGQWAAAAAGQRVRVMMDWRRKTCWIPILLLAAAGLQGLTPDGNDLSSMNGLRMLLAGPAHQGTLAGQDRPADDVCVTIEGLSSSSHCRVGQRVDGLSLACVVSRAAANPPSSSRELPAVESPRREARSHFTCRLTC